MPSNRPQFPRPVHRDRNRPACDRHARPPGAFDATLFRLCLPHSLDTRLSGLACRRRAPRAASRRRLLDGAAQGREARTRQRRRSLVPPPERLWPCPRKLLLRRCRRLRPGDLPHEQRPDPGRDRLQRLHQRRAEPQPALRERLRAQPCALSPEGARRRRAGGDGALSAGRSRLVRLASRLAAVLGPLLLQPVAGHASDCPEGVARPRPVKAPIEHRFGHRLHPVIGMAVFQPNMVFRTLSGQAVVTVRAGRVEPVEATRIGRFVRIRQRDGSELRYGPLSQLRVRAGRCVAAGARLGWTTSSPFTLALRRNEAWIDPAPLLGGGR
ncbi:MAG: M23 family metallopeptidase [Mycobacterium sp.]|nr:MAG: M23 family metallopeptidase [Mycobacterium sp.]